MKRQYQKNLKLVVNLLVFAAVILLCILLLPRLLVFFMPFVIGWIISCMANPLVHFLEHRIRIRRKAGTVMVIVLVIAAVVGACYLVISILAKQLIGFVGEIPQMWESIQQDFTHLGSLVNGLSVNLSPELVEKLDDFGDSIGTAITDFVGKSQTFSVEGVSGMVGSIANVAISVIMCLLSAYFFIADREYMLELVNKVIPATVRYKYDIFYNSMKQAFGGYIKAQFYIEIRIYVLILVGLWILRINYSFLIALAIAFLDFLPFFGSGAVFWPWALIKLLGGDYVRAAGFMVIWGVGQIVRQLIQPKIMGDSIGMEPIPTLFLLFIGYKLAGVGGMILAIPVGILLMNMNEAGIFDNPKLCMKLLLANLNEYRRLTDEDMLALRKREREEQQAKQELEKKEEESAKF